MPDKPKKDGSFRFGLSKADLQSLAAGKLTDATLLLRNGRHSSAYYISGYVIELALKAVITKRIGHHTLPDLKLIQHAFSHDLDQLLTISLLRRRFEENRKDDPRLAANWAIITDWNVESRYDQIDPVRAVAMVGAVSEEPSGVFVWIQKHW